MHKSDDNHIFGIGPIIEAIKQGKTIDKEVYSKRSSLDLFC